MFNMYLEINILVPNDPNSTPKNKPAILETLNGVHLWPHPPEITWPGRCQRFETHVVPFRLWDLKMPNWNTRGKHMSADSW